MSKFRASLDSEDGWYVSGPASDLEFSYHGGTLASWSRFQTKEAAEIAAALCELAYQAGQRAKSLEVRKTLGL